MSGNVNDAFPSKYLKASDLKGRKVPVQISHVTTEKVGDDTKPVLYFVGKEKGLVLNKTNAMTIAATYGGEFDGWGDKPIVLYPGKATFNNQVVDSLKVEVPAPEPVAGDAPVF